MGGCCMPLHCRLLPEAAASCLLLRPYVACQHSGFDPTAAGRPIGPSPSGNPKPINPFEAASKADPPSGFSTASGGMCAPGSITVEQAEGTLRPSASFDHLACQQPQASFSGAFLQPALSANPTQREQRQWQSQVCPKCCRLAYAASAAQLTLLLPVLPAPCAAAAGTAGEWASSCVILPPAWQGAA